MKSHLAPLHHSPFLNPSVSKFKLLLSRISNARAVLYGLVVGLASSATIVSRPSASLTDQEMLANGTSCSGLGH